MVVVEETIHLLAEEAEVVEEAIDPLADATVEGTQSVLVLETFFNLG